MAGGFELEFFEGAVCSALAEVAGVDDADLPARSERSGFGDGFLQERECLVDSAPVVDVVEIQGG